MKRPQQEQQSRAWAIGFGSQPPTIFASAVEFLRSSSGSADASGVIVAFDDERSSADHVGGVCFVAVGDNGDSDAVWIGDVLHRVNVDAMGSQVDEKTKIVVVQQ